MPETVRFKACYRHPGKPAIKDCLSCGRPICKQCELESGDPLLCAPCKEALAEKREEKSTKREQPIAPPSRQIPFAEITVLDDGTVVTPDREAAAGQPAGDAVAADLPQNREPEERTPEPEPETPLEVPADDAGGSSEPVVVARASRLSQILRALPYTLLAAALVAFAWLLVARVTRQWTQISVFTLGLAVPWVLYSSTTRRKLGGKRIRTEPPVVLVSVFSFTIAAVAAPIMESLAYRIVYGTGPGRLPFSDFVKNYFKSVDWVLIAFGLAFALLVPFVLKTGSRWNVPPLKRKAKKRPAGKRRLQIKTNRRR